MQEVDLELVAERLEAAGPASPTFTAAASQAAGRDIDAFVAAMSSLL